MSTLSQVQGTLERTGVVFVPENGGGAGVRLFKERLVGWLQRETAFPADFRGIQDPFERSFIAAGAPPEMALFSRTADGYKVTVR